MAESNTASQIVFEHYDGDDERRREALLALGNGVLSWRASAPEASVKPRADGSKHYAGFYRAGWYDEAPCEVNGESVQMAALVNLPNPFGLSFTLDDGDWFSLDGVDLQRYRQRLDLDNGVLERQLRFELAGHRVELLERRLVSMATPNFAVLRWELQLPPGLKLRLRSVLDGGVRNAGVRRNRAYEGRRLQRVAFDHDRDGTAALSARLHNHRQRLAMATQIRTPEQQVQWRATIHEQRLLQEAECTVPDDGFSCPISMLKHVLLPAPFGPISARSSPLARSKLTSSTALIAPKLRDRLRTDRIGLISRPPVFSAGRCVRPLCAAIRRCLRGQGSRQR